VHGSYLQVEEEMNRTGEGNKGVQGTGIEGIRNRTRVLNRHKQRKLRLRSKEGTFSRQTHEPEW
jgi:hypothetical protein